MDKSQKADKFGENVIMLMQININKMLACENV